MAEKIFLSYAYQDRGIVDRIVMLLKKRGLIGGDDTSFIDPQVETEKGSDIREAIKQQMMSASKVVIIVTPNSAKSQWVNYEAGMASALGKPIILIGGSASRDVEFVSLLADAHFIEMDDEP
jgi:nucleoside 2-deoxyribosyltransferase